MSLASYCQDYIECKEELERCIHLLESILTANEMNEIKLQVRKMPRVPLEKRIDGKLPEISEKDKEPVCFIRLKHYNRIFDRWPEVGFFKIDEKQAYVAARSWFYDSNMRRLAKKLNKELKRDVLFFSGLGVIDEYKAEVHKGQYDAIA